MCKGWGKMSRCATVRVRGHDGILTLVPAMVVVGPRVVQRSSQVHWCVLVLLIRLGFSIAHPGLTSSLHPPVVGLCASGVVSVWRRVLLFSNQQGGRVPVVPAALKSPRSSVSS